MGAHLRHLTRLFPVVLLTLSLAMPTADKASGQETSERAELAPTGTLRVGLFGASNLAVAVRNPATGELRGVGADLGRELAARLDVPFEPVTYGNAAEAVEGLRARQVDVAVLSIDPTRAAEFDFSPPYLLDDMTYAVRADSPIQTAADADRPGVRIAVPTGSIFNITLQRQLQNAELVPLGGAAAATAYDRIAEGTLDAYAFSRSTMLQEAARRPGLRVVEGRFGVSEYALALPKERPAALAFLTRVVEQAKATGLVQRSAEAVGLPGVQVPPVFRLGFATLDSLIPDIVGRPVEDEHYGPNGDSLQRTTTGLMVWRKADNWTAFTNGSRTWVNGPFGVMERSNDEHFEWEGR